MTLQVQGGPDQTPASTGTSPWQDPERQAVAELARTFFEKEVLPHEDRHAEQGHPDPELYRRAGRLGLLGMAVPEVYGGGGGSIYDLAALILEQMAVGATSMGIAVSDGIVVPYLLAYAREEQKQRWLPRLCSGEWISSIAMTEPDTGSDLQAIRTLARREGDHYLISGAKVFISNGALSSLVVIAARTGPGSGARGISLLVAEVDDRTPGFRRGRILKKLGQRGADTTELFFDDLRVPAANLLGGTEGRGFFQMMEQLPGERLITAVLAQGMAEAAVRETVRYTKERQAFGAPLFTMQNTRFELAECSTITTVNRVFLDHCLRLYDEGRLDAATASMAKYWLTDRTGEVVDRCQQLFGGYGYMLEYPITRLYADNRVLRVLAGANEVMKDLIARSL